MKGETMTDLIRRQDAELILAREMYATSLMGGCDPVSPVDFLPEAKAWMSDAPIIRGWIPCSEREPSKYGTYLVTMGGEIIGSEVPFTTICGYEDNKWDESDIIAWMELPPAYKEETDETD